MVIWNDKTKLYCSSTLSKRPRGVKHAIDQDGENRESETPEHTPRALTRLTDGDAVDRNTERSKKVRLSLYYLPLR